jgi:hypothetical protein
MSNALKYFTETLREIDLLGGPVGVKKQITVVSLNVLNLGSLYQDKLTATYA